MRKTIVEWVSTYSAEQPDKTAVHTPKQSLSYRELFQLAVGYAAYLKAWGVKKGDIIVTPASQDVDYVIAYLGTHLAGGVMASLEKGVSEDYAQSVAAQLKAEYILYGEAEKRAGDYRVLPRKHIQETAQSQAVQGDIVYPDLDDSADILFTTGTTGSSKGVELSHKALVATAENLIAGCGYRKDTVMIVPGPLNHANAIRKLFTTLINGSTIYILNGMMNLKIFFDVLDNSEGSIACCLPPAAIRMIFQHTEDKLKEYANRIDFIESATSPLPEADKERLRAFLPHTRLYNNYGSSESASACMYDYNANPGREGCIGKAAVNARIFIVDDEHREMEASPSNVGLIACEGDMNMKGYVGEPELTATVLKDGVVYTSDLGYIDSEGFVYCVGRKGDIINVGGRKVAPSEVESVVLAFDGIDDCILIPVHDKITTNALKLLVVPHEGVELDKSALIAHMGKTLEAYKVPRNIEEVDHVARTYNGKLDRKAYRTEH